MGELQRLARLFPKKERKGTPPLNSSSPSGELLGFAVELRESLSQRTQWTGGLGVPAGGYLRGLRVRLRPARVWGTAEAGSAQAAAGEGTQGMGGLSRLSVQGEGDAA